MEQLSSLVIENKVVAPGVYKMRVEAPAIARAARPGQFLMVRVGQVLDPLIRRPFSIHAVQGLEVIDILYRVVGRGTNVLTAVKKGERLDIIGPLGRGFVWRGGCPSLLVAGGMGIAPLFFLAQDIASSGAGDKPPVLIIGARNKAEVLCVDELRALGFRVQVTTEDGSEGRRGLVTDLIDRKTVASRPVLYTCGPYPMLRAVAAVAKEHGLPCQVSA